MYSDNPVVKVEGKTIVAEFDSQPTSELRIYKDNDKLVIEFVITDIHRSDGEPEFRVEIPLHDLEKILS